jgi:hypothetical protein
MSAEKTLNSLQRDDLRVVAGMIIPASVEYRVPGADDATIQVDILATLGRDAELVRDALDHLARLAGMPLANLGETARQAWPGNSAHRADLPRRRLPASCCNAITATIVSCVRSGWSFARHFHKGMRWNRVTGRCWTL